MDIDIIQVEEITRAVLERFHTIHSIQANLFNGVWRVKVIVDVDNKQKELLIDSKTGRVISYGRS